jgi:hypothetical protein
LEQRIAKLRCFGEGLLIYFVRYHSQMNQNTFPVL